MTQKRLTIDEVMMRLGYRARSTVYRNAFLRKTAIQAGERTVWLESDVERAAQAQPRGIRRREKRSAA